MAGGWRRMVDRVVGGRARRSASILHGIAHRSYKHFYVVAVDESK